jgi:hypothetical protein
MEVHCIKGNQNQKFHFLSHLQLHCVNEDDVEEDINKRIQYDCLHTSCSDCLQFLHQKQKKKTKAKTTILHTCTHTHTPTRT